MGQSKSFVMSVRSRVNSKIQSLIVWLQHHVSRWWYGPFIGLLAFADALILIIPNDGILISSTMLVPKRWLNFAVCISIGSTLGAILLAALTQYYGLPLLERFYPELIASEGWAWSEKFFNEYGLWVVFGVAITPLIQQPSVILAALAHIPLPLIAILVFAGRALKFLFMAWVASHSPRLLGKLWGIQGELEEVGVKTKT